MKGRRQYRFWLILSISCLFVFLPFAGYGAGLVIGNDVTVNGDLLVTAQSPYWGHAGGSFTIGLVNFFLMLGSIPAGQRLVIEHVALRCLVDADDSIPEVMIWVNRKTGPATWSSYGVPVLAQKQGTTSDGKASWVVSQPVRLFSDGGTGQDTYLDVHHSKFTASGSCMTHVSGYTVITP